MPRETVGDNGVISEIQRIIQCIFQLQVDTSFAFLNKKTQNVYASFASWKMSCLKYSSFPILSFSCLITLRKTTVKDQLLLRIKSITLYYHLEENSFQ